MAKKKTSGPSAAPSESITEPASAAPAPRRRRAVAPRSAGGASTDMANDRPEAGSATAAAAIAPPDAATTRHPSYDEIAEAAYHRYLKRGGGDGRDFDDWLEAEQELRSR